jgi:isopenicillin N synthase-like dioxygenase
MTTNLVPALDLADFISGTEEQKKNFTKALGDAFSNVGFACVRNIAVTTDTIDKFYSSVQDFFNKDVEYKRSFEIPGLAGQRGYTAFGKEQAKGSDTPDLKEFWQIGQTVEDNDPIKNQYPDNVMITDNPEFNTYGRNLYKGFEESGKYLLRSIALYLGLDEFYFDNKIYNGNSILRAIHYPPITSEPKSAIRAEAHEDINLITLLVGASAEGLQLLTMENTWHEVVAPEGHIVINVGDMLQRLTNNKMKSTTHRVVNPPKEKWANPRFSIPFFLHPRSEMDLTCLDSCVSESAPIAYEPISAGDYLTERLIEIGLLKK